MGPVGFEPATKRIQFLIQVGYNFILVGRAGMDLAVLGSSAIHIHFLSLLYYQLRAQRRAMQGARRWRQGLGFAFGSDNADSIPNMRRRLPATFLRG